MARLRSYFLYIFYFINLGIFISCIFYNPRNISLFNQVSGQSSSGLIFNLYSNIGAFFVYIFGYSCVFIPLIFFFIKKFSLERFLFAFLSIVLNGAIANYYKIDLFDSYPGGALGSLITSNINYFFQDKKITLLFLTVLLFCSLLLSIQLSWAIKYFKQPALLINILLRYAYLAYIRAQKIYGAIFTILLLNKNNIKNSEEIDLEKIYEDSFWDDYKNSTKK